jgi:formylglycine-generating enzyme
MTPSPSRSSEPPLPTRSFAKRGLSLSFAALCVSVVAASSVQAKVHPDGSVRPPEVPTVNERTAPNSALPAPTSAGSAWQLIDGKYWQRQSHQVESTEVTDTREGNRGACPAGMVEVQGTMKMPAKYAIDSLQLQACTKWISHEFPERCAAYDRDKWLALSKDLPTKEQHFCIDRFEYPNQKGAYPYVMVSYFEGRDLCKAQGKRLCAEEEWTFACEGEEARPYPTGYTRDASQCVIDESWDSPKEGSLLPRGTDRARDEIARVFHGNVSGSERSCKSPFGVYDMTGNIDEWTSSSNPGERPSVLKGGYFGPVRTRCRPATRAHNEWHIYYQEGFRCCSDAG